MNLLEEFKASLPWTYRMKNGQIATITDIGFVGTVNGVTKSCWDSNGDYFEPTKIYILHENLRLEELLNGGTFKEGRRNVKV